MTPEGQLKKDVQEALTKAGVKWFRMPVGKVKMGQHWIHMCPEGTADLLVCPAGRMPVWIELKGRGQFTQKARREKQQAFADQMRDLGHGHLQCASVEEVWAAIQD